MLNYLEQFCQNDKNKNATFLNETFKKYPTVSLCLEQPLFVWLPCILFCVFTPFWLHMLKRKKYYEIKTHSYKLLIKNVDLFTYFLINFFI